MKNIFLVNLKTGETMSADPNKLIDLGMPEGFRIAENVSAREWAVALKSALREQSPEDNR